MIEFLIGLVLGVLVGWLLWSKRSDQGPRTYHVTLDPHHTVRLHRLGRLSEAQVRSLAIRLDNRQPFRLAYLTGRGGVMTRRQFEEVREELIERGMAWRRLDRRVDLTPSGEAFIYHLAGRARHARSKQDGN